MPTHPIGKYMYNQTNVASMIFNPCWHNSELRSANQLRSHSWIFEISRHDVSVLSTTFHELALARTLTPETNSMATTPDYPGHPPSAHIIDVIKCTPQNRNSDFYQNN